MKIQRLFYSLLFFLVASLTQAQYTATGIPYSPSNFQTGTHANVGMDDMFTPVIPLGFSFNFYGTNYTMCTLGSNGEVSFDLTDANTTCLWSITPNQLPDQNCIFTPYHDTDVSVGGDLIFRTEGTVPYRRFICTWYQTPMYSGNCTNLIATSQVILYETTNAIEVFMENKPVCPTWNGGLAVLGIVNQTGSSSVIPPNRGTNLQWTAQLEGWRFCPNVCLLTEKLATGKVFFDIDHDCNLGMGDLPVQYPIITARDTVSNAIYYCNGDISGNYQFQLPIGVFELKYQPPTTGSVGCVNGLGVILDLVNNDTINNIDFSDNSNNIISGHFYIDANNNCVFDSNENPIANQVVHVNSSGQNFTSDSNGYYSFIVSDGTYQISPFYNSYYSSLCASNNHTIVVSGSSISGVDFGLHPNDTCGNLRVTMMPVFENLCDTDVVVFTVVNNSPSLVYTTELSLHLATNFTLLQASLPYGSTGTGSYTLILNDTLIPGEMYLGTMEMAHCATQNSFCNSIEIADATASGCVNSSFFHTTCGLSGLPLDPNDMMLEILNRGEGFVYEDTLAAGDQFNYRIRFQNIGTAAATNVVIRNYIPDNFNVSTLRLGVSSHPYTWHLEGRYLVIYFNNIMLPDSSQNLEGSKGFVSYFIERDINIPAMGSIYNSCDVYFDNLAPIHTNYAILHFPVLVSVENPAAIQSSRVNIYPVPAKDLLYIDYKNIAKNSHYQLISIQGIVIAEGNIANSNGIVSLSVSDYSAGVYFVKIIYEDTQKVEVVKVVLE